MRERAEGEAEGSQGARAEVGRVSRTKGGNEGGAGDGRGPREEGLGMPGLGKGKTATDFSRMENEVEVRSMKDFA